MWTPGFWRAGAAAWAPQLTGRTGVNGSFRLWVTRRARVGVAGMTPPGFGLMIGGMNAGLLPIIQRRTRTPLALGILVAVLCVVAETLLTALLQQITPVRFLGIMYLLGVVLVAAVWGLW